MIAHWDLVQCSREWHELKWGKVGGSSSKGLFVKSDTLLIQVLSEHIEPFIYNPDGYVSDDMQRGIDLEPVLQHRMSKFAKVEFKNAGWLQSERCSLIGISPDGITADLTVSYEGKCPQPKKHAETLYLNDIPSDNIHQCLHYFTVNEKLEKHYFASFRPECDYPLFVKLLTRETPINLGTKAKPVVKEIGEWAELANTEALELEANLSLALQQLDKI